MPISQIDIDYMHEVAKYFRSTKTAEEPDGSIRDTAIHFGINRNKVRKILVTMEELKMPITEEAIKLRKQGNSIKEIAEYFGVNVSTVSIALPYGDKFDNTADPSKHASEVRDYRAYEKKQMKRQADLKSFQKVTEDSVDNNVIPISEQKEWQKDIKMSYTEAYHRPHRITWKELDEQSEKSIKELSGNELDRFHAFEEEYNRIKKQVEQEEKELELLKNKKSLTDKEKKRIKKLCDSFGLYDGALNRRNYRVLEEIAGDKLPPDPRGVLRLHLELYRDYPNEDITETLKKYGAVQYGDSISRDIIVPEDIPLYALHYAIQRAFGWENSHLRQFELPEEKFNELCNNALYWYYLVGIVFRSPLMREGEEFWADDYNGGSFKNWLRKKYTGPYMSQCHGEGIISCEEDMSRLDMEEEHYLLYCKSYDRETDTYSGDEYLSRVEPVYDYRGNRREEPKPWGTEVPYRVEIVSFEDVPAEGLRYLFERDPRALLERLPINKVLAAGINELPDNCSKKEREHIDDQIISSGEQLVNQVQDLLDRIVVEQIDSPVVQPIAGPITDVLYYNYDFGDNWMVKITASENCPDLVESGRITQSELDRANVKCREVYRPVLIARDGDMVLDDVGGLSGFADFLKDINPDFTDMTPEEKEEAKERKKEMLTWAKGLGWHREKKVGNFNLL